MRLASVAIVLGLLALALVGTAAIKARQRAANAVGRQAEPLLAGAEVIYTSLADADATATNTFLKSGLEAPDRRQAYLVDLATGANQLSSVGRQAGTSKDAAQALTVINRDLPTSSGLIEAARADNRQGLPVGAAYLREGSRLMQAEILPAVGRLYQVEAGRLNGAYRSGSSAVDLIAVLLFGAPAIVILAQTQFLVTRRTNRLLNPALAAATVLTVVLMVWSLVAFAASATRLREARTRGSDPVQLLSSARILLSRATADENLALVARGSGSQYLADFDAVTAELGSAGGSSGLLAEAEHSVPAPASGAAVTGPYAAFLAAHTSIVGAAGGGQFATAVAVATGTGPTDQLTAASQVSGALSDRIVAAQKVFDVKAAAGAHDLSRLGIGLLVLLVLAAGLSIAGLQQRINEYR